ncbi:MAG: extracellular solute-binding protein [Planctomycetota bacterium]|nr:extracellular solute-binding protein [Planctomycetota bacterium]MDA1179211.1 extracellular solute-binding protein [Planctomycetota bacterium]
MFGNRKSIFFTVLAVVATTTATTLWLNHVRDPLVVYCAHDSVYAEPILRDFERRTGIPLDIRFDTEATKSFGFVERLIQEQKHPRADVFWNNEVLGMMQLQVAGVLTTYRGPGYDRIPAQFKDAEGAWAGFGARFRVVIVNSELLGHATEERLSVLMAEAPQLAACAKPLYGTTRLHYTALWKYWGPAELQRWHDETRAAGLVEAAGNAMVKDLVAGGSCRMGWTDSDDFFSAQAAGSPVKMFPWRLSDGQTVCIPNSVAILKNTRHLAASQQLVDFLLSAETEVQLARSNARQVPLGKVPLEELPAEVRQMQLWVENTIDLAQLDSVRTECLNWLKAKYVP